MLEAYNIVFRFSSIARRVRVSLALLFVVVLTSGCSSSDEQDMDLDRITGEGTRVTMQYTIRLSDGTEVASNVGAEPLSFTIGQGEIFAALESSLTGLVVGDERSVSLSAEQAYGPRDENDVREVDLELVPEESRLVGAVLMAEDDGGSQREVTVREIREKTVLVDLNHPLAGEDLSIDIRIVNVRLPENGQ